MLSRTPPLCFVTWAAQFAKADTILFQDVSGQAVGSSTFAGDLFFCASDHCNGIETGHGPGDVLLTFGIASTIYMADQAGFISEKLVTTTNTQNTITNVDYSFDSGLDLGNPTTCASVGGCQFTTNGTVQTLGTLTWSDDSTDKIQFQAVPEPSTLTLLSAGLLAGVLSKRLRRA